MKHTAWLYASLLALGTLAVTPSVAAADPVHARVTRWDNIHIRVSDPAKATGWYVKHLGARRRLKSGTCGTHSSNDRPGFGRSFSRGNEGQLAH